MNLTAADTTITIEERTEELVPFVRDLIVGATSGSGKKNSSATTYSHGPMHDPIDWPAVVRAQYSVGWQELIHESRQAPKLITDPLARLSGYRHVITRPRRTAIYKRCSLCPAWRPLLENVENPESVVAALRLFGLTGVADRLTHLRALADDDPDEASMEIESLKSMALFLMGNRNLREPQVSVTPAGFLLLDWRFPSNGVLALEFLPSGMIRFAGISAPATEVFDRRKVNGVLTPEETLDAVRPFTNLIEWW